jgi:hypothetical protein
MAIQQPERPQPVRSAANDTQLTALVSGAISASVKALILFEIIQWTTQQEIGFMLVADSLLIALVAIVARVRGGTAAQQVTPLENPHIAVGTSVNDGRATVVGSNPIGSPQSADSTVADDRPDLGPDAPDVS